MGEIYRTLVPENEISIWPRRLTAPQGEPLEFPMITIAEIIVKICAPENSTTCQIYLTTCQIY
jgi:hypothetical protein